MQIDASSNNENIDLLETGGEDFSFLPGDQNHFIMMKLNDTRQIVSVRITHHKGFINYNLTMMEGAVQKFSSVVSWII